VKIFLLARTEAHLQGYGARPNLILPLAALDGSNLIASADLVISAGGTMNREAAALGVPAATIYAGRRAAIDEELVREGRLRRISTREDLEALPLEKKRTMNARRAMHVRSQVVDLILGE
jgi:predicted glycosyltransferase